MKRALLALAVAAWHWAAIAQPLPPDAGLDPRPGAALPLDPIFTDSEGRTAPLRDHLGGRPVLLVPGYYRCPQLCGLLMQALLQGLHDDGASEARIVRVSIDPAETPADAAQRRQADLRYAAFLGEHPDLHLLTGDPAAIRALTRSLGWRYRAVMATADDPAARFAHPAAVVVVTPDGHVAGYLGGLRFERGVLARALDRARDGRARDGRARDGTGEASGNGMLALLCAHFDPRLGRHTDAVLLAIRAVSVFVIAALVALWWRQAGRRPAR